MDNVKTYSHTSHASVMLDEVLAGLNISENKTYLDCTFGRGGYSRAIMAYAKGVKVIGVDRDKTAQQEAESLKRSHPNTFDFHAMTFDLMDQVLAASAEIKFLPEAKVDGIVFDLGVSSPQLDVPERGFSFRFEGPLDMRMGTEGITAADVVNTFNEDDLATIIYRYGEEKKSRVVAKAIVMDRQKNPFETTTQLAGLLRRIIPKSKDGIDPATRTFQALRIFVNDELGQLERALEKSIQFLKPGGRLVVVSFHSLEDRIVKTFLNDHAKKVSVNKYKPQKDPAEDMPLVLVHKKAVVPSDQEIRMNPRSRSAKLRVAERKGQVIQ